MELESQVAKIQLGAEKDAGVFVYLSAEKLPLEDSESFLVAEILENDEERHASCEQIVLSINAAIRRTFKKNTGSGAFEASIAQVNSELGKLASMGEVNWIDKLNCIIGVKIGAAFNIATTGKVAAYLLRGQELTDISCSANKASHPLKTFENFAAGKLKLGDILILSTNQLFNHISVDRLKSLLNQGDFLKATGRIVELLKANAAGKIAVGSILALEVEKGSAPEEQIDLEEYIESAAPLGPSFPSKVWQFIISAVVPGKRSNASGTNLTERASLNTRFGRISRRIKAYGLKIKNLFYALRKSVKYGKDNFSPSQVRQFSPQKKFFFFSALILLFALLLQVTTAVYLKSRNNAQNKVLSVIAEARKNLSDADAALLYKDEPAAKEFYLKSMNLVNSIERPSKNLIAQIDEIKKQGEEIKIKLEKTIEVGAENLGTLAESDFLIKLPEYLAAESGNPASPNASQGGTIVSFNKDDKTIRDDVLKSPEKFALAEAVGKNKAAVYADGALKIWDYIQGSLGPEFISSVPKAENAAGLKFYPANSRVYMLDKSKNQILNFAVLGESLGRSLIAVNLKNDDGRNAVDLALDGSIYILTPGDIKKYHSGAPESFGPLALLTPLSSPKKIITKADLTNIYILDSGNRRIVVLNKKGGLVYTLINSGFTDLRDFEVDEKNRMI